MGDGAIVQAENALDDRGAGLRNLDGTGVAAVSSVGMLEADEFHVECLFHVGSGTGQGDGAAVNFIAARKDFEVVFTGKVPDELDIVGLGAIGSGEVAVTESLAAMLAEIQRLAVFQDDGDFNQLMRRSRPDGTRSRHGSARSPST
jgi:hypothetical protein